MFFTLFGLRGWGWVRWKMGWGVVWCGFYWWGEGLFWLVDLLVYMVFCLVRGVWMNHISGWGWKLTKANV